MLKRTTRIFLWGVCIGAVAATGVCMLLWSPWATDKVSLMRESGISRGATANVLRYTHERRGFSLEFPKELAVASYPEGNASETLVFQKPGDRLGFQIFFTPYLEKEITKERLAQDVAGGTIESPTEVVIGNDIRALIFWSQDPIAGRLREAWFIHDGFLYEVTAYAELDEWLATILKTWRFEE